MMSCVGPVAGAVAFAMASASAPVICVGRPWPMAATRLAQSPSFGMPCVSSASAGGRAPPRNQTFM